jgi:thiol-disulfide isomerase/thioredoxin
MADKYNKLAPKVHPLTYVSIIGFLVIVFGIIFALRPSNEELIYLAYEPTATSDFTEDHPFYQVQYESSLFKVGLDKIIDKNEIVLVYIGNSTCASCQAHIGAFQKYFYSQNFDDLVSTIYYLNTSEDLDGFSVFSDGYLEVTDLTPQLLVFQNGVVIQSFTPVSTEDTQALNRSVRDFYDEAIVLINE